MDEEWTRSEAIYFKKSYNTVPHSLMGPPNLLEWAFFFGHLDLFVRTTEYREYIRTTLVRPLGLLHRQPIEVKYVDKYWMCFR